MADETTMTDYLRPADVEGPSTAIACPECRGAIWHTREGDVERYRCHVGHAYTEEAFVAAKREELEIALWTALRALREHVAMYRSSAERARKNNRTISAEHYEQALQKAQQQAAVISKALGMGE